MVMKIRNLFLIFFFIISLEKIQAQQSDNYKITNYSSFIPNGNRADSLEIEMWPNPAKSEVNIYVNSLLEEQKGELILFDNNGAAVLTKNIGYGSNKLYLSNVANGYYTVRILRENGVATTAKLIVAK